MRLNISHVFITPIKFYGFTSSLINLVSHRHIPHHSTAIIKAMSSIPITYYALGPILLACICNVLIFCLIRLMWFDYVYHWFAWCPYQTFPLSWYLAALDSLMHPSSPSYSGLHLHSHAPPLACLPLHQFWHAWVLSVAITKIFFAAYSVPYQASVSPCLSCWCIASASCDLIFLWLSPSCIYSVCIRPESLQTWSSCNPRTINHLLELCSPALPKSSF